MFTQEELLIISDALLSRKAESDRLRNKVDSIIEDISNSQEVDPDCIGHNDINERASEEPTLEEIIERAPVEHLETMLQEATDAEKYEIAAKLHAELKKRRGAA